jgi:hypothetical protein
VRAVLERSPPSAHLKRTYAAHGSHAHSHGKPEARVRVRVRDALRVADDVRMCVVGSLSLAILGSLSHLMTVLPCVGVKTGSFGLPSARDRGSMFGLIKTLGAGCPMLLVDPYLPPALPLTSPGPYYQPLVPPSHQPWSLASALVPHFPTSPGPSYHQP